ncbi:hypothetical protein BU23DRAFT_595296 [Bimuria novae-zelandiae CBS 107.79]|uniref:Uncharacterized protein n=1 Tax=Bimuria novae-zelandiae CBS 107.79 TaxID=1447943 RepID=A0A6A5VRM8_9PLEO|nr:hypothetical protein BU23DRAFT_595296 [Bimuria novae-zelandiae CBS 107.79]
MDVFTSFYSETNTRSLAKMIGRKVRCGARGRRKVKSGCSTCKYSEAPTFVSTTYGPQNKAQEMRRTETDMFSMQYNRVDVGFQCCSAPATFACTSSTCRGHFDYFQAVCAPEFSMFFQMSTWTNIVLRAAWEDQSFRRIALAISALTRSRYERCRQQRYPAIEYALWQCNLAIRELSHLDNSLQNLLRMVLMCISLITLEFLLENC